MFVQRYLKKAGDFLVKSCELAKLEACTEIANELFATIKQRDTPETGFNKFHVQDVKGMDDKFEESIVEDFSHKLSHVNDFKVAFLHELPSEARSSFVDLASMVIEQHQSFLTHIDF